MQDCKEMNDGGCHERFEYVYKILCHERCTKQLPAVEAYLREKHLRLCADRVELDDWLPIIGGIARNRDLTEITIYSRSRRRKVRERINSQEKLETLWRYRAKELQQQPIIYTNLLLRCLLNSIAICARESSALKSLVLDGIPLSSKYLRILCDGLFNNRSLQYVALPKCAIGDTGCDMVLNALQNIPNLWTLNLSSCCLTCRSVASLALFVKKRKANILQNVWNDTSTEKRSGKNHGLYTLILSKNNKLNDNGIRQLMHVLRDDLWLKTLGLRHCGITKTGAEAILEFIQTNRVVTAIDLRENDIPLQILRSITKILRTKDERVSGKKKSLDWKHEKEEKRSNRRSISRSNRRSISRSESAHRQFVNTKTLEDSVESHDDMEDLRKGEYIDDDSVDLDNLEESELSPEELESKLSSLTSCNETLEKEIEKNKKLVEEEKNRRAEAEKTCEKIKSLLERLKDKLVVRSWNYSQENGGNQVFDGLRGILKILEEFPMSKLQATEGNSNEIETIVDTTEVEEIHIKG
ncbi:hypothetical protein KPH14_009192 [Odynerus spinipes]|uniref:Centrosomal protein of 78 kDa n=1 Tax=Odynerus spinipes TaxID=1348599 RepID=A0AAD9RNS5_9HYME|nr:hypothetical protein KPH14_009192 [Odynerus spinipes]